MQSAGQPAAAFATKMDSSPKFYPSDSTQRLSGGVVSENAGGTPSYGCEASARQDVEPIGNGNQTTSRGSSSVFNSDKGHPVLSGSLMTNLNSLYFCESGGPLEGPSDLSSSHVAPPYDGLVKEGFACVLWELEQLPMSGELIENVVARLEALKHCSDEVSGFSSRGQVSTLASRGRPEGLSNRFEALTSAVSG